MAAKLLLESGYPDDACNRAYYAMFDAARAALFVSNAPVEAEVARTHRGLISAFGQYVVKPGLVAISLGKSLNRAQEIRLLADYSGDPVDGTQAAELVLRASEFVATIQAVLDNPPPQPTGQSVT
jgi:uncharacterized protein (UPF0332 family)